MTTSNDIDDTIKASFFDSLDLQLADELDPKSVSMQSDLFDEIGLDSLGAVALGVELQRTFRVKLVDEEVRQFRTLAQYRDYIVARMR